MGNIILETAIKYVTEKDFAVFPCYAINPAGDCACRKRNCSSPGKHPIPLDGVKSATKDLNKINDFFWCGTNNIGIATGIISNLVVLDVDPKNGGDLSLKKLCDEIGEFETYTVRTGSGGLHFYFRYPATGEIRNSVKQLGPGLDIRGIGGYVIAPPSNHISGNLYEVIYDK